MLGNTPNRFGLLARCLHWFIAILTLGLIGMGWWMMDLGYYDPWYYASRQWHEALGLLVWLLGLFFACGHLVNRPPKSLTVKRAEKVASQIAHKLLYLSLLALPVAGYLIETADGKALELFGLVTLPAVTDGGERVRDAAAAIHTYGAYGLLGLVGIHAAGAVKHHLVDRDRTLMRTLSGR